MPVKATVIPMTTAGLSYFFAKIAGGGRAKCFFDRLDPGFDRAKVLPGAVISFEYEDKPMGPLALRPITLIAEAGSPGSAPVPATAPSAPITTNPAALQWPPVDLAYSDPRSNGNAGNEEMTVTVKLGSPGNVAQNWQVSLKQAGQAVSRPARKSYTNAKGETDFISLMANTVSSADFVVTVYHRDQPKEKREYGFLWTRKPAAAAVPTTAAVTAVASASPQLKVVRSWAAPNVYQFDIDFTPGKDVKFVTVLDIQWRRAGEADTDWKNRSQGFSTVHGKVVIELKLPEGQYGKLEFASDGVTSKPFHIENTPRGAQPSQAAP